jgi:hypothetical protein
MVSRESAIDVAAPLRHRLDSVDQLVDSRLFENKPGRARFQYLVQVTAGPMAGQGNDLHVRTQLADLDGRVGAVHRGMVMPSTRCQDRVLSPSATQ